MTGRRILQLDVGNSSVKWRLMDDGVVRDRGRSASNGEALRDSLADSVIEADAVWVASVLTSEREAELERALAGRGKAAITFARVQAELAGVTIAYAEPATLGVDRWLALLAARARCSERVCVVDAGTAVTVDFLDGDGCHEGGYILPGRALMERALFSGTHKVRYADLPAWSLAPGNDTATVVGAGLSAACVGALDQALRVASSSGPEPRLLVTGGDGAELLRLAGRQGTVVEDLVFEGLAIAVGGSSTT